MKEFVRKVFRNKTLLLMTLPAVVYLIMFNYIPMYGITIAFKNYNYSKGIFGSDWVGLKNFKFLLKSGDLWLLLRNTIGYNLIFIFLGMALAVILAIFYDALGKSKLVRVNQTLSILPHFLSAIIIGHLVYIFLASDKGILNHLLIAMGREPVSWYSDKTWWPFFLILVRMWIIIGWNSIIYYSSIKGIDTAYYDAARVDGASWVQQVKYITLPLLKPTVIVMMIMSLGNILASDFSLFYIIPRNSGALYSVTSTLDTYVYNGLRGNATLGMTSAVSVFQSIVGFVLVCIVNKIIKVIEPEHAMF